MDTLVLCYHAVSPSLPADLAVTPAEIERQLSLLVRRGYRGVTFSEAVASRSGRVVAVTFDDAFRSVYELGLPILERLGLPATLFVPTSYVDGVAPMSWPGIDRWSGGPHASEMMCLGRSELLDLAGRGWEIGAHTHTHPHLSRLTGEPLMEELRRPRQLLEQWLDRPCHSLAYPFGDFSPAVIKAARSAGYKAAASLDATLPVGEPLLWPRVGVYREDRPWRYRLKVSPLVRRLRLARLRHPGAVTRSGDRPSRGV